MDQANKLNSAVSPVVYDRKRTKTNLLLLLLNSPARPPTTSSTPLLYGSFLFSILFRFLSPELVYLIMHSTMGRSPQFNECNL